MKQLTVIIINSLYMQKNDIKGVDSGDEVEESEMVRQCFIELKR